MVMHPHTKYHWPISEDKNAMAQTRKYYFKNHCFRAKTCFSFQIGQWCMVCGCMTIRQCVAYHNDLHGTLILKPLFDLQVKGQGHTQVIAVRDTPPYGHAPTYQISFTYLERQTLWPRQENTILVCGYMTIRWCVAYRNDLRGTLTFDLKVK
jgi:hypothetical protein